MSAKDIVLGAASGGAVATPTYVDDVFSTYLYTGNGSTQTITNGIDLAGKGGLVWIKSRNITGAWNDFFDTERGVGKQLSSNVTGAQFNSPQTVTVFSSSGFSVGSDADVNRGNAGDIYASWTFRKAAKFFDILTWTGDGNTYPATRTLNHSLGIAPGMIVIKVTSAVDDWVVYHAGLPSPTATYLRLNTTEAARSGTIIDQVTSTSFRITDQLAYGADSLNQLNQTYVAYVFAHDTAADSMIKCGSYTATGLVNLGFEPQYILSRCISTNANWKINDSMRGITGSTTASLATNTSSAEENSTMNITLAANGFNVNTLQDGAGTYIYMAIRRPNKPPTSGTQVFSAHTWTQSGGI